NIGVEHGDKPAHRAYEALWLAGTPVHILGPIDRGQLLGQRSGQNFICLPALFSDHGREVLTFGSCDSLQAGNINTGLFGKSSACGSWLAIFECHLRRGTGELLGYVRLSRIYSRHENDKPSGRGVNLVKVDMLFEK